MLFLCLSTFVSFFVAQHAFHCSFVFFAIVQYHLMTSIYQLDFAELLVAFQGRP